MSEEPTIKRCAIYTRKSTEEGLDKEFNSLEAQFDACAAYIHSQAANGWELIDSHYDDPGYSGGNMNRPALQVLLRAVREGKIDVVVVYKMDRISRSLADFMELTKLFEQHKVSVVSVTQKFDTSTSMGRMMLNMLMTFAQFEREMTSDRIRDKMAATRKKGMWTGGVVPYGYKSIDRKLVVDPSRKDEVLFAFEHYAQNHSFLQTTRDLLERFGTRGDGSKWTVMNVRCLLKQAIPAGKIRDNKTGELFEGVHEAIVPFDLWQKVQQIIEERRNGVQTHRCSSSAPLKGVIRCGYCDCSMVPSFGSNGQKRYYYYRCEKTHKHLTEECQLKTISADIIEDEVFKVIGDIITNEFFIQTISLDGNFSVQEAQSFAAAVFKRVKTMTKMEKQRFVQLFLRKIEVRRDGIDIIVRPEGFKNLLEKGNVL